MKCPELFKKIFLETDFAGGFNVPLLNLGFDRLRIQFLKRNNQATM